MGRMATTALLASALAIALTGCRTTLQVADGDWHVECLAVSSDDCRGVAQLFVNNLARNGASILEESRGRLTVTVALCPELPEWADRDAGCFRAQAPTTVTPRACMIVSRLRSPAVALAQFGWVGGDTFTGLAGAPEPGTEPC